MTNVVLIWRSTCVEAIGRAPSPECGVRVQDPLPWVAPLTPRPCHTVASGVTLKLGWVVLGWGRVRKQNWGSEEM
eukprot:2629867-Prorocentrum_lima.AAC.1